MNKNYIYIFLNFLLINIFYSIKTRPKISIIIPIYNINKKYLKQSINSILKQNLKEFEIILVDNNSNDSTPQLLDYYASKFNNITVIHKMKNEMNGFVKNSGLDFVTGEYLMFLDYDDFINPNLFEIAYNEIKDGNFYVVKFEYKNLKEDEQNSKEIKELIEPVKNYSTYIINENRWDVIHYINVVSWNKIYKSSFIFKNGFKFSNINIDEDSIFFYTYFPYLNKIKILTPTLIMKNKKNENFNKQSFSLHFKEFLNNLEIVFKIWKRDEIIKISNSKKFLSIFYSILKTYCKDSLYQEIFIKFLLKHRNIFNIKFIEKDNLYRNFFRSILFKNRNETDYQLYNLVLNKDHCEY